MKDIKIESLTKYIEHIESVPKKGSWLYRGHKSVEYKLIPSIGRKQFLNNTLEKNELTLLKHFKDSVVPFLKHVPDDEWEWIAIAQHYGLPTRLLDWSYNPLIAKITHLSTYSANLSSLHQLQQSLYPKISSPLLSCHKYLSSGDFCMSQHLGNNFQRNTIIKPYSSSC
jgi:hypothetical protein